MRWDSKGRQKGARKMGGEWGIRVGELLGVKKSWIKRVGKEAAVFLGFSEAQQQRGGVRLSP